MRHQTAIWNYPNYDYGFKIIEHVSILTYPLSYLALQIEKLTIYNLKVLTFNFNFSIRLKR